MTYQEFLNSLLSPINYFLTWLGTVSDSLIHNYIFITLLGISLFISLFWLIYSFIYQIRVKKYNKYNDYNDNNINFHK